MTIDEVKYGRGKGGGRFLEIANILRRHRLILGVTPEKLRAVLEDLGPTFVKLGQMLSMRTDLLPLSYCEELQKLRSEVKPMPMDEVARVVEASLGVPLLQAFRTFDPVPLGSASIAQAHAASLPDGRKVVVKVQREGIFDRMASDIALLRMAVKPLKFVPTGEAVDFDMVLAELWNVSQQEMDFLHEADNAEEFIRRNADVAYVGCPKPYRELSTRQVLVMEAIDGIRIDDREALEREDYDPAEISLKLCTNYMKQVLDDGFFHADPHPGNLRLRDGQIVFLDLGMVGRLSDRDRAEFEKAFAGVAARDADAVTDAVIAITKHSAPVDRKALHDDVKAMLDRYLEMDIGRMNLGEIMQDYLRIGQNHRLMLPQGVTLLGRGISTLEGLVADISPETNLLQIVAQRFAARKLRDIDLRKAFAQNAQAVYESVQKSLSTPALLNDTLRAALRGDLTVRVETAPSAAQLREVKRRSGRLNRTIVFTGLFVGSCLLTLSGVSPRILGVPWVAVPGFGAAALYALYCLLQIRRGRE
jgi:ubiquinone biosynthesis protein